MEENGKVPKLLKDIIKDKTTAVQWVNRKGTIKTINTLHTEGFNV